MKPLLTASRAQGERALMETVLLQTAADLRTHAHAADQSAAPHILAVATDEAEAASIAHSLFLQVVEPALTTLLGVSGRVLDALQRHATVPRQLLQLVRAAGDVLDRLPHLLSALQVPSVRPRGAVRLPGAPRSRAAAAGRAGAVCQPASPHALMAGGVRHGAGGPEAGFDAVQRACADKGRRGRPGAPARDGCACVWHVYRRVACR